MDANVSDVPKNCNGCVYKQILSRHWELEDYCALSNKKIEMMVMEEDCPLRRKGRKDVQSTTLQ